MGRRLVPAAMAFALVLAASASAGLPGVPRVAHNAADMARAKSAQIRQSDLPSYFRVDPKRRAEPLIPQCGDYPGDRSSTTVTGEAMATFTGGTPVVGSKTLFFKTSADLDRYWKRTVRNRFVTCDAHVYASTRKPSIVARTLFARQLPLGGTGTERAAAYRTITRQTAVGYGTWDWYDTRVFLASGRGLSEIQVEEAMRPCACYVTLARVLGRRLIAASHG